MQTKAKLHGARGGSPLLVVAASLFWLSLSMSALAQLAEVSVASTAAVAVIPQQVRYTGALANRSGETVEAVFSIYATAEGGEALWTETQRVSVSADGSYSVVLGAASQSGLPQAVFAAGQARWLGVTIDRAEGVRSPLSSVAYAMKAGDAESVGGIAAASLVTKEELAKLSQTGTTAVQGQPQIQPQPALTPTGSGTADYVALWTASGNLGDSNIYQAASGNIGIGTVTPGGPFTVVTGAVGGSASSTMELQQTNAASGNYYANIGLYNSTGLIGNLSALGAGYPVGNLWGANDIVFLGGQQNAATNLIFATNTSGALKLATGGYKPANERLRIGAAGGVSIGNSYVATDPGAGNLIVSGKVGIGASTPAATLEVNGTAKFDGLITFGAGQTFPGTGAGTITGVTATSPLTGGGTSGPVTLGLNTTALATTLENTYDDRYALLSGDVFFTNFVIAEDSDGPGNFGLNGFGTSGSGGTYGSSDSGYGVEGLSTSGQGVVGTVSAPPAGSAGVLGYVGKSFSKSYSGEAAYVDAGVWADTTATPSSPGFTVALMVTADNSYGEYVVTNSENLPSLLVENSGGTAGYAESYTTGDGLDGIAKYGNGLVGKTSGGGDGVYGINLKVVGQTAGVKGVAAGTSTTGAAYDIYGGIWGDTGLDTNSVPGYPVGVLGSADNGAGGYFENTSDDYPTLIVRNYGTAGLGTAVKGTGLFSTFMASSETGTCGIGSGGSMSCTGPIKSLASAGGGSRTVETYAVQSPENWMEDFGTGSMEHGVGVVQIDPAFAETVTGNASYHVFLTQRGDSKGPLYVTNVTATSFQVREANGGTSSLSFDYRIVAKRLGYEAQRLTDVTDTFTRETSTARLGQKVEGVKPMLTGSKPPVVAPALTMPHRTIVPSPTPRKILPLAKAVPAQKAATK